MPTRRQLILGTGGILALAAGTLALGAWRSRSGVAPAPPSADLPLPLTAMSWQLTSHLSARVGPGDWVGRPALVFFGFTWCPDVCPTTLMNIAGWLEELGSEADKLTIALISVDSERDTPEVMSEYVAMFDPRILGLTGSPEEIALTAAEFRIRYEKVPRDDGDYTMNHTAGVFLFYPDGRFASIIDFHEDPQFAVPKIKRILA
ncbi:SCO family protein [Pseudogemmobacter bohemicus]|uniref:SCO family protein n=1 Tax=Pseudogemmobacter bohemicus TaxID=2250708 RepID=UPI000DD44EB5|nr:SCO family protein [Pseudogemmobacter bohemicus]